MIDGNDTVAPAQGFLRPEQFNPEPISGYFDPGGLTKRELFAAMAMQGLLGNQIVYGHINEQVVAQFCVCFADTLIAELNKPTP